MSWVTPMRASPPAASPGKPGTHLAPSCMPTAASTCSPSSSPGSGISSGFPVSPTSLSPSAYHSADAITEKKLWEFRLLCRLIGLHSRPNICKDQRINIYLPSNDSGGTVTRPGIPRSPFTKPIRLDARPGSLNTNVDVKVVGGVDIGANTKCLLFLNDGEDHLYICFNWFDPKSLVDVLSLTCRLASTFKLQQEEATSDKAENGGNETSLHQIPFLETARNSALAFWNDGSFQGFLRDAGVSLRPGAVSDNLPATPSVAATASLRRNSFTSNLQRITCGGFSIGGPTAFYMAALLATHIHPESTLATIGSQNVRAVAFGSPRFCGKEFVEWCEQHLAPSSCSVILYSPLEQSRALGHQCAEHSQQVKLTPQMILDPVCVQGCGSDGFTAQPHPFLLKVGGGLIKMTAEHESEVTAAAAEVEMSSSSVMWSMATRMSPFTKEYNERYSMLHSVLQYYEALADTRM